MAEHPPPKWKKVYVFISSTFNDMHAERDYLVKRVFPELGEWCSRRRLQLIDIDLRWGVTEADAAYNKNVANVCLRRIDQCRPFFISFVGQRRGWVPKKEDLSGTTFDTYPDLSEIVGKVSITEMEIMHAVLEPFNQDLMKGQDSNNSQDPGDSAFFFLRKDHYLEELQSEDQGYQRRVYTNDWIEDETERQLNNAILEKWRKKLLGESFQAFEYDAKWDNRLTTPELSMPKVCPSLASQNQKRWRSDWDDLGIRLDGEALALNSGESKQADLINENITKGRLTQFALNGESLGDGITRKMKTAIKAGYPEHFTDVKLNGLEHELDQNEQFLSKNSDGFLERDDAIAALDDYVRSTSNRLFVVTAESGVGKTTLLANWIDKFRQSNHETGGSYLTFRFVGLTAQSLTPETLLFSLLRELKEIAGCLDHKDDIPVDPVEIKRAFPELLAAAGKKRKIIIVIDGLDQFESGLTDLEWLPNSLPANIRLIVSLRLGAHGCREALSMLTRYEAHVHEIKSFYEHGVKKRIISDYLNQYLKELDENHVEILSQLEAASNPLYLKVILSELRVFGAHANLKDKLESDFGQTTESAFQQVLSRLETDAAYSAIDPKIAVTILFGLLASARNGLTIKEMESRFAVALKFQKINATSGDVRETMFFYLRQMRSFIFFRDNRYDFFYTGLKRACRDRYQEGLARGSFFGKSYKTWDEIHVASLVEECRLREDPSWQLAGYRSMHAYAYHLARIDDINRLLKLYIDPDYLLKICREKDRTGSTGSHKGVYTLLAALEDAVEQIKGKSSSQRWRLLKSISAIQEIIVERSQVLSEYPECVVSEVAGYIGLKLDKKALKKIRQALSRKIPEFLFPQNIAAPSKTPKGHLAAVTALAGSSGSNRLISGAKDGVVAVWDTESGQNKWLTGWHRGMVTSVNISPDNLKAVSTGEEGRVTVWELSTGKRTHIIDPGKKWKFCSFAAFSDDRTIVAVVFGNLCYFDAVTGQRVGPDTLVGTGSPKLSPNLCKLSGCATWFAFIKDESKLVIIEVHSRQLYWETSCIKNPINICFGNDGESLFIFSYQGEAQQFDVKNKKAVTKAQLSTFEAVTSSLANPCVYAVTTNHQLMKINTNDGLHHEPGRYLDDSSTTDHGPIKSITEIRTDIAVGFPTGRIDLIQEKTQAVSKQLGPGLGLCIADNYPDNKGYVALQGPFVSGQVKTGWRMVFADADGRMRFPDKMHHSARISGVAALSSKRAVSIDFNGTVLIWRKQRVEKRVDLSVKLTCCGSTPKGNLAIIASDHQQFYFVTPLGDIKQVMGVRHHRFSVGANTLDISADPTRFAYGSENGNISYMDMDRSWFSKPDSLTASCVAVDPKGRYGAMGNVNGRVFVWKLDTEKTDFGNAQFDQYLHNAEVVAIAFDPDSHRIYTAGADQIIKAIDITSGDLMGVTKCPGIPISLKIKGENMAHVVDSNGYMYEYAI